MPALLRGDRRASPLAPPGSSPSLWTVHELAPRLLLTLAGGQAPYAAMPDERSDRIALALRRLQRHDLIEQPAKREWQISDPLMSTALARLRGQANAVELYPQERSGLEG